MSNFCCTSDFNGDVLLSVEDYRLYFLWDSLVDKGKPVEEQIQDLEAYYTISFPSDPVVTVDALPELDCADYAGTLDLSVPDYRLYFIWDSLVDHDKSEQDQLSDMQTYYAAAFPSDPAVTPIRIPKLLDPDNCASGWFVVPWFETKTVGSEELGWFQ